MAASATTIVKGAEEQGNFFTRLAWYYQMGVLLLLAGLLFFASDYLLYNDKRAETVKIREQVETLRAKNQQASIIQQNLKDAEAMLKEESGSSPPTLSSISGGASGPPYYFR